MGAQTTKRKVWIPTRRTRQGNIIRDGRDAWEYQEGETREAALFGWTHLKAEGDDQARKVQVNEGRNKLQARASAEKKAEREGRKEEQWARTGQKWAGRRGQSLSRHQLCPAASRLIRPSASVHIFLSTPRE